MKGGKKVKVFLCLRTHHEDVWGSGGKALLNLSIDTGCREWSVSFFMGKNSWYRLDPEISLDLMAKREISAFAEA
jgi:hypothetical protein